MRILLSLAFSLILGCTNAEGVNRKSTVLSEEAAIYEAVLRYAFSNNAFSLQDHAGFYVVELGGRDAPFDFIARLTDVDKPVYPISKVRVDCNRGVYLKGGSKKGIQFLVGPPEYESSTQIKVSWSYSEGCTSSAFSIMKLKFKDGVWVVFDNEVIVIS